VDGSFVVRDRKVHKVPANDMEALRSPLMGMFEKCVAAPCCGACCERKRVLTHARLREGAARAAFSSSCRTITRRTSAPGRHATTCVHMRACMRDCMLGLLAFALTRAPRCVLGFRSAAHADARHF
jgi:hypothetical protein